MRRYKCLFRKSSEGNTRLLLFLIGCLSILITGCGSIKVKHASPVELNALESNERVVFGRIIFITHSEEIGEVSFSPLGLGFVHAETERRSRGGWFKNDGTFFWILPVGSYQIDALGWGYRRHLFSSAPRPGKPKTERFIGVHFNLKPEKPPECGFVVNPNVNFTVSGDSGALYLGSLLIDMDIKINHGIEAKNINSFEIKDEYAEALELLKSLYPSFTLTVEKRLMTSIPDRPASMANGRCPTGAKVFIRDLLEGTFRWQ